LASTALAEIASEAALTFDEIVDKRRIVNWTTNVDVQNRIRQDFDDYLVDLRSRSGLDLGFEVIDQIVDECIDIAKVRRS
jgi:hypothetical protein